MDGVLAG